MVKSSVAAGGFFLAIKLIAVSIQNAGDFAYAESQ